VGDPWFRGVGDDVLFYKSYDEIEHPEDPFQLIMIAQRGFGQLRAILSFDDQETRDAVFLEDGCADKLREQIAEIEALFDDE